jgi:HPt (histidine-containing phosphotransfer) domain-containing protein
MIAERHCKTFDYEGAMERVDGDVDLFVEILKLYFNEMRGCVASVQDAVEHDDPGAAAAAAHAIKGCSANVGAEAVAATASELVTAGRTGDLASARSLLSEVRTEFRRLASELDDRRLLQAAERGLAVEVA